MRRCTTVVGQTLLLCILGALLILNRLRSEPIADNALSSIRLNNNDTLSKPANGQHEHTGTDPPRSSASPLVFASHPEVLNVSRPVTSPPLSQSMESQILQVDCGGRTESTEMFQKAESYALSIMDSSGSELPRLQCPPLTSRYSDFQLYSAADQEPRYYFAMSLHQSAHILQQLLGAVVEAVRFLGPQQCVISLVEGRSTDGTFEILKTLVKQMEQLGVSYFLSCSSLEPNGEGIDRIAALAELRNRALQPLTKHPDQFDPSTTIIFLNDVAACAEDILELIHQRAFLQADMTCGMDWYAFKEDGGDFYDSWIGRQINGDTFFEVPQSTSWEFSKNLFWNHPNSKSRYEASRPLQVFSCWNGAVAITAKPFLDGKIRFRTEVEGECHLGEPVHLAKDLWREGYGNIVVIPSINVGYTIDESKQAKDAHGWVSSVAETEDREMNRVVWERPPGQIKCLGDWHEPSWERFDLPT